MRLKKEQADFLARLIVEELIKEKLIEVDKSDVEMLCVMVDEFVLDQLLVEDRLNDEVRKLLEQHREQMYQENINYQDMFKMIKRRLIEERNLVI